MYTYVVFKKKPPKIMKGIRAGPAITIAIATDGAIHDIIYP